MYPWYGFITTTAWEVLSNKFCHLTNGPKNFQRRGFENPKIALGFDAKLKLQNLYNAFKIQTLEGITGELEGGISSSFDMKAIEKSSDPESKLSWSYGVRETPTLHVTLKSM